MNTFSHVPPGFRFHPTDEELVHHYLKKKVASKRIDPDVIKDIDLYKIEPWDLQELCKIGNDEEDEWYFFSHKDKKYPTGTRTNRATKAGFWKATGRDKAIYCKHFLTGMRKTLVFYRGRAPNGQKSDWIMHEYRLQTNENGTPQEEGWVVCRVFKKRTTTARKMGDYVSPCWYDDQVSFMQELESPMPMSNPNAPNRHPYPCKKELELQFNIPHDAFLQLPQLHSPVVPQSVTGLSFIPVVSYGGKNNGNALQCSSLTQEHRQFHYASNDQSMDHVMDWRVLDQFVDNQLSHHEHFSSVAQQMKVIANGSTKPETGQESASTSISGCQIDLWK
ncbi:NAC domain-containing protein 7-like isoform X2 [Vigna unguiculata]|uniref:NAC domain-containing protein n=2 Tax=Vigna unguiculata TaxID=3917 RepID=A0A4D6LRN2_VIGUN|nr:NAC domain-containing protein 7-like isoform X2 [Vigna unguiculata]QCD91582.1 hypothetical protein DEO72_LG4g2548 [Vigna unguiculata]